MTLKVKAVLFDLDGTLWDRDRAFQQLTDAQHGVIPALADIARERYVARVVALDNYGMTDKRSVYAQVVSEFGLPLNCADTLFQHFTSAYPSFCDPFPDALPTLQWLRARDVKLGVVTNGSSQMQQMKIEALGLVPLLDVILISEREGVRKPDPAIFHRALTRLGVDAGSAWFVGDHPEADIRGASEAGMTAVWRRSRGDAPHATHTIAMLDELIPLLSTGDA